MYDAPHKIYYAELPHAKLFTELAEAVAEFIEKFPDYVDFNMIANSEDVFSTGNADGVGILMGIGPDGIEFDGYVPTGIGLIDLARYFTVPWAEGVSKEHAELSDRITGLIHSIHDAYDEMPEGTHRFLTKSEAEKA